MTIQQFPHCDSRVLHAPGTCEFCDAHPEWQELRQVWNINFTGPDVDFSKLPCPATRERPLGVIHQWPGNRPRPADGDEAPVWPEASQAAWPHAVGSFVRDGDTTWRRSSWEQYLAWRRARYYDQVASLASLLAGVGYAAAAWTQERAWLALGGAGLGVAIVFERLRRRAAAEANGGIDG